MPLAAVRSGPCSDRWHSEREGPRHRRAMRSGPRRPPPLPASPLSLTQRPTDRPLGSAPRSAKRFPAQSLSSGAPPAPLRRRAGRPRGRQLPPFSFLSFPRRRTPPDTPLPPGSAPPRRLRPRRGLGPAPEPPLRDVRPRDRAFPPRPDRPGGGGRGGVGACAAARLPSGAAAAGAPPQPRRLRGSGTEL